MESLAQIGGDEPNQSLDTSSNGASAHSSQPDFQQQVSDDSLSAAFAIPDYPSHIQQDDATAVAVALPASMTEAGAAARANFAKMFLEEEDLGEEHTTATTTLDEQQQSSSESLPTTEQLEEPATEATGSARKRKSRWGVAKADEGKEEASGDPNVKPKRKSRFQLDPAFSAVAVIDPRSVWQQEMITVQARLREINAIAANPGAYKGKGFDGPSPDPIYDSNGKRTNTRESRVRDGIKKEQQDLVAKALDLQSKITGMPVLPNGLRTRREVRIPIPFDTYPDYNFKGVLIGARGLNQKRLEKETNCMIAVRGKGMRKKLEGVDSPEDNMDVHVLVAAYDQTDLDKGVARVKELLVPVSLEERQKQLRELDVMNGTVRPEQMCHGCGESGHKLYNCPKKFEARTWKPANIVCTICGDVTHAFIDCPSNRPGVAHSFAQKLNSEYDNFMAELTGEKPPEKKPGDAAMPPGGPNMPILGGGPRPPFQNTLMPRIAPLNPVMSRFPMGHMSMGPRPGFNPLIQGNPFLGKFGMPEGPRPATPGDGQFRPFPGQGPMLRPGMGMPSMLPAIGGPTGSMGPSLPSSFPPLLPSHAPSMANPSFPSSLPMPGPSLLPPIPRMDSSNIPPWLQNPQSGPPTMPHMGNPYLPMMGSPNSPWLTSGPGVGMPPTPYYNNPYANIPQPTPTGF